MSNSFQLNSLIGICLLCWSTWGIFDKKALESARHLEVLIYQHLIYVLEVPLIFLLLGLVYPNGWQICPETWGWTALGSSISSSAMLFYLIAMSRAEASFVLGITASYPLIVQILAHFFLHEALVPERLLGSILIGLGVACIGASDSSGDNTSKNSGEDSEHQNSRPTSKLKVLILCSLATLFWGLTGLFDKKALLSDSPFKVYFARCVWDAAIVAIMLIVAKLAKQNVQYKKPQAWRYSFLSSVCLSAGTISYMFAMTMATASYIIVITGCYPLFMYLFALLFLKEKLKKTRLAGVLLVVIGGLLVQETQGV